VFLLDSDHLSILQRKSGPELARLQRRLAAVEETDVYVSIISFHEQVGGWHKHLARSKTQRDVVFAYQMFQSILHNFNEMQVLAFDDLAASKFSELRKLRIRVGTMDLRIAAVAIVNKLTLLTRNTVDFERVPGLRFEDWTVA
jgi:tRNA(fMet)-specific endonuclease VapC